MGSKSLLATLNTFQHRVQNLAVQNANLLSVEGGWFKGKKLHIFLPIHIPTGHAKNWPVRAVGCLFSNLLKE